MHLRPADVEFVLFRFFAGVIAALTLSPTSVVLAVGEPSLVVADLPGYVHEPSAIDGEITGATVIQANGTSVDAAVLDQARSHTGQGRSWRSSDGTTVAMAWVLDYGTESAAFNMTTGITIDAWRNGTPFEPGLAGTVGVSMTRAGEYVYSVFWQQGTHFAVTTVSGPDATRAAQDVTLLARLEADVLEKAIGSERTVLGASASTESNTPTTPGRSDLARWVIAVAAAMILVTAVLSIVMCRGNRHGPPLANHPHIPESAGV